MFPLYDLSPRTCHNYIYPQSSSVSDTEPASAWTLSLNPGLPEGFGSHDRLEALREWRASGEGNAGSQKRSESGSEDVDRSKSSCPSALRFSSRILHVAFVSSQRWGRQLVRAFGVRYLALDWLKQPRPVWETWDQRFEAWKRSF